MGACSVHQYPHLGSGWGSGPLCSRREVFRYWLKRAFGAKGTDAHELNCYHQVLTAAPGHRRAWEAGYRIGGSPPDRTPTALDCVPP